MQCVIDVPRFPHAEVYNSSSAAKRCDKFSVADAATEFTVKTGTDGVFVQSGIIERR